MMLVLNSDILENNFQMVCEACLIFRLMCDVEGGAEMSLVWKSESFSGVQRSAILWE